MSALAEAGGQLATFESDPRPVVAVRLALEQSRIRGLSFAEAWPSALEVVEEVLPTTERTAWREALRATLEEWRAAYERRPTVLGVTVLAALGDDLEERDARPGTAPERPPRSKWCSACKEWKGIASFNLTAGGDRQAVCQRCVQQRVEESDRALL